MTLKNSKISVAHIFSMQNKINIIVSVDRNHAIGRQGDMPYHISPDLKRFKALTMGCPVVMGRKTFESLPKGALPGRRNIVITRDASYSAPNIETVSSLDKAIELAQQADSDIFIIGGGEIYRQTMGIADNLYITYIDDEAESPDTFFPEIDSNVWDVTESSPFEVDERSGLKYKFVNYTRKLG